MSRHKRSRKQEKMRDRRRRQRGIEQMKQRFAAALPNADLVFGRVSGGVKMSEVLARFVEPYKEAASSEGGLHSLFAFALAAWNATLMPEDRGKASVDDMIALLPDGLKVDARTLIQDMMDRKRAEFASYRRMIFDYTLVPMGDRWDLTVISSPEPRESGQP